MNDDAGTILLSLVSRYGPAIARDALRCEALLRDTCPRCRREIFVLVNAVRQQVPADLLSPRHSLPPELFRGFLKKRLQDELAFSDEAATWAVDTWAMALDVDRKKNSMDSGQSIGETRCTPGITFPEDTRTGTDPKQRADWAASLESRDSAVRLAAIRAMARDPDSETLRLLVTALENPHWKIREAAFDALVDAGDRGVPHLIDALCDTHGQVVTGAALALGALRAPDATLPLIDLLEQGREGIPAALWALGEIHDSRAITPLTKFQSSRDPQIAAEAGAALKKFG
ncbi:MAG TPA: HEAT repeat domain-containing protein [Methanoregula sp.]|nr:HEAT repeat domain-containing protein [Methanoregula sp.]